MKLERSVFFLNQEKLVIDRSSDTWRLGDTYGAWYDKGEFDPPPPGAAA